MKSILVLLIVLASQFVNAQQYFQRTYGNNTQERCISAIKLSNGDFSMLGDYYYPKILWVDSTGRSKWAADLYDVLFPNNSKCTSFVAAPGNCIVMATNWPSITKVDPYGNEIWTTCINTIYTSSIHTQFYKIIRCSDSGYLVKGWDRYLLIVKADSMGNLLWANSYDVSRNASICELNNHDIIIATGNTDIQLICLRPSGLVKWSKKCGSPGGNLVTKSTATPDGGFILTGNTNDNAIPGFHNVFLLKLDSTGVIQWGKTYSNNYAGMEKHSVIVTDSEYVVGSTLVDTLNYSDILLFKSDQYGNLLWSKTYGGNGNDDFVELIDNSPDIVIAGNTRNFSHGSTDYYLLKVDSSGNSGCNQDTFLLNTQILNWVAIADTIVFYPSTGYTITPRALSTFSADTASYDACICIPPVANFYVDSIFPPGIMQFWDSSVWADNYTWDFGDGTISNEYSDYLVHDYYSNGYFNICLTVSNSCGADTFCYDSTFIYVGEEYLNTNDQGFILKPNPADQFLSIGINTEFGEMTSLLIFSSTGQVVYEKHGNELNYLLDLNNIPGGIYLVLVTNNMQVFTKKLIIDH